MPNCLLSQLTIAIPAKDEENNIAICLQAIGNDFCNRVVVIDSASSDATSQVARKHGADVIDFYWDGHFPKNAIGSCDTIHPVLSGFVP